MKLQIGKHRSLVLPLEKKTRIRLSQLQTKLKLDHYLLMYEKTLEDDPLALKEMKLEEKMQ